MTHRPASARMLLVHMVSSRQLTPRVSRNAPCTNGRAVSSWLHLAWQAGQINERRSEGNRAITQPGGINHPSMAIIHYHVGHVTYYRISVVVSRAKITKLMNFAS